MILNTTKIPLLPKATVKPRANDLIIMRDVLTGKEIAVRVDLFLNGTIRSQWLVGTTYNTDDYVEFGLKFWRSLQDANLGNVPAENAWWTQVDSTEVPDVNVNISTNPDFAIDPLKLTTREAIKILIDSSSSSGDFWSLTGTSTLLANTVIDFDSYDLEFNLGGASWEISGGDVIFEQGNFIREYRSDTLHPNLIFNRSRAALTAVQNTDVLGEILFNAYADSAWQPRAAIRARVNGVVTGATVPTELVFYANNTALVERMIIRSNGVVESLGATPGFHVLNATSGTPFFSLCSLNGVRTHIQLNNNSSGGSARSEISFSNNAGSSSGRISHSSSAASIPHALRLDSQNITGSVLISIQNTNVARFTSGQITVGSDTVTSGVRFKVVGIGTTTDSIISLRNSADTERFRVFDNGLIRGTFTKDNALLRTLVVNNDGDVYYADYRTMSITVDATTKYPFSWSKVQTAADHYAELSPVFANNTAAVTGAQVVALEVAKIPNDSIIHLDIVLLLVTIDNSGGAEIRIQSSWWKNDSGTLAKIVDTVVTNKNGALGDTFTVATVDASGNISIDWSRTGTKSYKYTAFLKNTTILTDK